MSRQANKPKKNTSKEMRRWSLSILFGDLLSSRFFQKNKFTILIIVALFMVYITFKYECQTHMEKISKLQTELSIARSECIRERSSYMSRTRESVMQHMVDSLHLGLKVQDQPPFILESYEK